MPLELFRQKKQTIYWIVAIVVIPSFIFAWGMGSSMQPSRGNAVRAVIDGTEYTTADFDAFYRRLSTVLGKNPTWVLYGQRIGTEHSILLCLAALEEARRAGIEVTDAEVGTFVNRSGFLAGVDTSDKAARDKAYREFLQRASISHSDFMTGVRDWLAMVKWISLTDTLPLATPQSAYIEYVRRMARFDYVSLDLHIDDATKDKAMDELLGVSEEKPEGDVEVLNAKVEQYLMDHQENRALWSDAEWRFEYLLAPFAFHTPEVDEETLKANFEANKSQFEGKAFEEVRGEVQERVIQEMQKRFAESTITVELENELLQAIATDQGSLESILQSERLVQKRGLVGGVSGDSLQPTSAFESMDALGDCLPLKMFLQQLDQSPPEAREEEVARLMRFFDDNKPPLECEKGYVRIRLLDYVPAKPQSLRDAEGNVNKQLRNKVVKLMQDERATELAKETAEEMGEKLVNAGREAFGEQLKELSAGYDQLPNPLYGASLNEPEYQRTADGWRILMLTARHLPPYGEYAAGGAQMQEQDLFAMEQRLRGRHMLLSYGFIVPGPRLQTWATEGLPRSSQNDGTARFLLVQPAQE